MLPHEPRQPAAFTDQHTIETPEQMPLQLALAGIGSRFLAIALDTLIQVALIVLLVLVVAVLGTGGTWSVALFIAGGFLVLYGYFAFFEIVWNGQTPGKRAVGIRVVKDSGRPLTAAETIGRNLLRVIDQIPVVYLVGVTVALLNKQNKRLGDFVAGSILVREASLAELKAAWQPHASAGPPPLTALGASALSVGDLALIDTFLSRRHSLAEGVRHNMAHQILERLKPKLAQEPAGNSAEAILEALAYERRSTGQGS